MNVLNGENVLSAGALAANTMAIGGLSTGSTQLGENYFIFSLDTTIAMRAATIGDGPIHVGVAHSDYSIAEIEEWLEVTTVFSPKDLRGQEVARRKIRRIGIFDCAAAQQTLNEGMPIRTKLGWMLPEGQVGLVLWVYNTDTGALTTGPLFSTQTTWFGKWVY